MQLFADLPSCSSAFIMKDIPSSHCFRERIGGGGGGGGGSGGFVTIIWIPKSLPVLYTGWIQPVGDDDGYTP